MASPIRILTAVPICDGHDSAINTINLEFIRHGIEVVYLGYHRSVGDIVRAAIQEDVRAIGISSYNGGHIEFFAEVIALLRKRGANDIKVFGGGGGTITHQDAAAMKRKGVDNIFFAGTSLAEMTDYVRKHYGKPRRKRPRAKSPEQELAHKLTEIENAYATVSRKRQTPNERIRDSSFPARGTRPGYRFHRTWRCRENDIDRRACAPFFESKSAGENRNFIARSERDRRRSVVG